MTWILSGSSHGCRSMQVGCAAYPYFEVRFIICACYKIQQLTIGEHIRYKAFALALLEMRAKAVTHQAALFVEVVRR